MNIDMSQMVWASYTDKKYQYVAVGDIVTLDSPNIITLEGSSTNENGYYNSNSQPMRLQVTELRTDSVTVKLLDGVTQQGTDFVRFFEVPDEWVSLKELSDRTIDPTTGEVKDEIFGLNGINIHVVNEENVIDVSKDIRYALRNMGVWSAGDGTFTPKYVTTLNAVLEDGTVIKQKWVRVVTTARSCVNVRLLELLSRN